MIVFKTLSEPDFSQLADFLSKLSSTSRSRFGPHGYDFESVGHFYQDDRNSGILGFSDNHELIAYAILRKGFLEHDRPRLESYGLRLDSEEDATYAPAVADAWQGRGIGYELFAFTEKLARSHGLRRIILWGGVQAGNERAVGHYQKIGFRSLGGFEYNGWNLDMVYEVPVFEVKELLGPRDTDLYHSFFIRGLLEDESSFRISPEDESGNSFPTEGKPDSFTLGAFVEGKLAGVVSFEREGKTRRKLRHKGLLFRMLVGAEYRSMGIGKKLIDEVIARAKKLQEMEQINVTVIASNPKARQLYERAGFQVFSQEKNAIKWNGIYQDELMMVRFL